jgi:hypothetical protein
MRAIGERAEIGGEPPQLLRPWSVDITLLWNVRFNFGLAVPNVDLARQSPRTDILVVIEVSGLILDGDVG